MRIKDRIYRAFTGSRPNVLSKVLEDCAPRQTAAIKPKRKKLSDRTMQLIATAASFAIIISAVGGGFVYFRNYFAGHGKPSVSDPATGPSSHSNPTVITDPADPLVLISQDTAVEIAQEDAFGSVIPAHTVSQVGLQTDDTTAVYYIALDNTLRIYHYWIDAYSGAIIQRNETEMLYPVEAYEIAVETVLTDPLFSESTQTSIVRQYQKNNRYYYYVELQTETKIYAFHIDCLTGEITNHAALSLQTGISWKTARDLAFAEKRATPDTVQYLDIMLLTSGDEPVYQVCYEYDGFYYEATVSMDLTAASAQITYYEDIDFPQESPPAHYATWQEARDVLMDNLGLSMDALSGFDIQDTAAAVYYFTFQHEDDSYAFFVPAYDTSRMTGGVITPVHLPMTAIRLRDLALDSVDAALEDLWYLEISQEEGQRIYYVSFSCGDNSYYCEVSQDNYISVNPRDVPGALAPGKDVSGNISWQEARDTAFADCGVQTKDITAIDIRFSTVQDSSIYTVSFQCGEETHSREVDARTGEIINPDTPLGMISEEDAKQITLAYTNYAADSVSDLTAFLNESDSSYLVSFDAEGVHYEITVHANSGMVQKVKLPSGALPKSIGSDVFAGARGNLLRQGLTHFYDSPDQLKLRELFGRGFDDESQEPTDEETAYLNTVLIASWANMDLFRLPADKMDQVLQQYYGIRLDELDAACFEGLAYMESTDCYYFAAGDCNAVEYHNINAYRTETLSDGSLRIYYYLTNAQNDPRVVTLRQNDRDWVILSNQKLADITDPTTDEPADPDSAISFWGAADLALAYTGFSKESGYLRTITGNRIGDYYEIYLSNDDILYKVTVKAYYSFDILDFEMIPLVEGGFEYKFESLLLDYTGWYNAVLTHTFTSVEELNLQELFYTGFADEPSDFTAEELALLDGFYVDLMRLPKEKMDAVLQTYFGTSLSKLDDECFAGLMYLESTDCYYHAAGDTNRITDIAIWSAELVDFEIMEIRYRLGYDENDEFYILTLRHLPGGTWQIISNIQE